MADVSGFVFSSYPLFFLLMNGMHYIAQTLFGETTLLNPGIFVFGKGLTDVLSPPKVSPILLGTQWEYSYCACQSKRVAVTQLKDIADVLLDQDQPEPI